MQGGGGTEMPNIGWEGGGPVGLRKKNCDLAQTGAILRQEGSGSMSVNSTVVQNVLWSSRYFFFNGIHPFPSAKSLRYYDKKSCSKKKI